MSIRDEIGQRIHLSWLRAKWNDLADTLIDEERRRSERDADLMRRLDAGEFVRLYWV